MPNYSELAKELMKGARLYKVFENGAEIAKKLEGLEQHEKQLTKSCENRKKDLAKIVAQVDKSVENLSLAEEAAKQTLTEAQEQSIELIAKANSKVADLVQEAEDEVKALHTSKSELIGEISELVNSTEEHKAAAANAEKELEDIRSRLKSI